MTYGSLSDLFKGICDAIRAKKGTSGDINHQDIPSEIESIQGGSVQPTMQSGAWLSLVETTQKLRIYPNIAGYDYEVVLDNVSDEFVLLLFPYTEMPRMGSSSSSMSIAWLAVRAQRDTSSETLKWNVIYDEGRTLSDHSIASGTEPIIGNITIEKVGSSDIGGDEYGLIFRLYSSDTSNVFSGCGFYKPTQTGLVYEPVIYKIS